MQTMQLFDLQSLDVPLEERISKAHAAITKLFNDGLFPCCAFSGGKDSSVTASLVLNAARDYVKATGKSVTILMSTSETRVENPELAKLFRSELSKMVAYGAKHGIRVLTEIVTPNLLATWQLKVLSGRGLPSYAGTSTDCSVDLKITPQNSFRQKFFKQLEEQGRKAVTCLGTRYDESVQRAMKMALRGEHDTVPVANKLGDLILSPIANWSSMDVFEYLGNASSNLIEAYSDFKDTLRIYSNSAGTSCAVVAEAIHDGAKRKKGGCGARHGCFLCQQAEDKSLANMVQFSDEYAYAQPLLKLNEYIRATRYDWNRRHWVGRTIAEGYISVEPDTFHPSFIKELTRLFLQADFDEEVRAARQGEAPMFQLLPMDIMVALDAMQSLNGVARPFQIWKDYRDIRQRRVRYEIPVIDRFPPKPMPAAKFLYVGKEWDTTTRASKLTGMRDAYIEALTETSACKPETIVLNNGHTAWEVETSTQFSVDMESVAMLEDFEMEALIETNERGLLPSGITYGYKYYLRYGCLTLSHSQQSKHDEVLRRTAYKDRLGLTLDYDIEQLYQKAIPFAQLPPEARKAWSHKATTESAQIEMDWVDLIAA